MFLREMGGSLFTSTALGLVVDVYDDDDDDDDGTESKVRKGKENKV